MTQSHHEPSQNFADVSYYADNEGNVKAMDHCKALQLELDYFTSFNLADFKAHIDALRNHYNPAQHPDEIAKYQCAIDRINKAVPFLSSPKNRYLKLLRIHSRFKDNESKDSEVEKNISLCFAVDDIHLDEKIYPKLGAPVKLGRVGLLSKKSNYFYFETAFKSDDPEVKKVGEKLIKNHFPADPENWVVFYITKAPLESGGYDIRDVRFVDEELQKNQESQESTEKTGLPTLQEKLFVIEWAVQQYDVVGAEIRENAQKKTEKKEETIFDTLLTLTPLEQRYSVEDAYIHKAYSLRHLSSYLVTLQKTGNTRPAVTNLLDLANYYCDLSTAKKPVIIQEQEDEEKQFPRSLEMDIKICSAFYHIFKKSDEKTQKIILNSIWMKIGKSKYPWAPERACVEFKIEQDKIVIGYEYTTTRSNKHYKCTYTFKHGKAIIVDTSPDNITKTLTAKNGQVTADFNASKEVIISTLNIEVTYLCVRELLEKVMTHVDALWQDPRISETEDKFGIDPVVYQAKKDDFTKLISLPTGQKFGVCTVQGRRSEQEDTIAYDAGPASKLFATLSESDQKKVMQETFANLQKTCGQSTEGSCVCAATGYVVGNKGTISTSYVGDSVSLLIILDKNKNVKVIKVCNPDLHNAKNASEVKAIKEDKARSKEGFFLGNRLAGGLTVTRAIGDIEFEKYGLSHVPETTLVNFDLDEGDYAFMVVGCDGMTEPFKNDYEAAKEISNLFSSMLNFNPDFTPARLAELIVTTMLSPDPDPSSSSWRPSKDNISVFVVPLFSDVAAPMPIEPLTVVPIDGHGGNKVSVAIRDAFNIQFKIALENHLQTNPDLINSLAVAKVEAKSVPELTDKSSRQPSPVVVKEDMSPYLAQLNQLITNVNKLHPEQADKTTSIDTVNKKDEEVKNDHSYPKANLTEAQVGPDPQLTNPNPSQQDDPIGPDDVAVQNKGGGGNQTPASQGNIHHFWQSPNARRVVEEENKVVENEVVILLQNNQCQPADKIPILVGHFSKANEQTILSDISAILSTVENTDPQGKINLSGILTRIDAQIAKLNLNADLLDPNQKELLTFAKLGLEEIKKQEKTGLKVGGYGLLTLVVAASIVAGLLTFGIAPVYIALAAGVAGLISMSPAAVSVYKNSTINERLDSIAASLQKKPDQDHKSLRPPGGTYQ